MKVGNRKQNGNSESSDSDGDENNGGFRCETCRRVFTQRTNLYRHKKMHTTQSTYTCPVCHVSYKRKYALNQHMKKAKCVNKDDDARQWACDKCDKRFHHKTSYTRHTKSHHNDLVTNNKKDEEKTKKVEKEKEEEDEQKKEKEEEEEVEQIYEIAPRTTSGYTQRFIDSKYSEPEDEEIQVVPESPHKEAVYIFLGSSELPLLNLT